MRVYFVEQINIEAALVAWQCQVKETFRAWLPVNHTRHLTSLFIIFHIV